MNISFDKLVPSTLFGNGQADAQQRTTRLALGIFLAVLSITALARAPFAIFGNSAAARRVPSKSLVARVVLLSDTHLAGPQYKLGGESNELDNLSVTKTQQRLWDAVQQIHAISPQPDLGLFLGDVVHNGLDYSTDLTTLVWGPVNGYHIASSLLSQLQLPTLFGWGNHDYKVTCGDPSRSASRQLSHRLFAHFFAGAQPYGAVDVGGWRVVMLNSLLGHTWDPSHPECNTRLSSYGPRQLQWLRRQLQGGRPTVVALHHPLPTSVQEGGSSLVGVLSSHANVKLVLSGHFHKGFDWQDLYPFPHLTLPAIRYDPANFFLLELHPDGSFRMVDREKNRGGARCSDAWTYRGAPAFHSNRSEGDCGNPLVADTPRYTLPPIRSPRDLPSSFNPEASCSAHLATALLKECVTSGASDGCCELLSTQVAPTSSWPLASCLCQPSFWKGVSARFAAAGKDAANIADECAIRTGAIILRIGSGSCRPEISE